MRRVLTGGCAALLLSGCGGDDVTADEASDARALADEVAMVVGSNPTVLSDTVLPCVRGVLKTERGEQLSYSVRVDTEPGVREVVRIELTDLLADEGYEVVRRRSGTTTFHSSEADRSVSVLVYADGSGAAVFGGIDCR